MADDTFDPSSVEDINGDDTALIELGLGVALEEDTFDKAVKKIRDLRNEVDQASANINAKFDGSDLIKGAGIFADAVTSLFDVIEKMRQATVQTMHATADKTNAELTDQDVIELYYNVKENKVLKEFGVTPDTVQQSIMAIGRQRAELMDLGHFEDNKAIALDQGLRHMGLDWTAGTIENMMVKGGVFETARTMFELVEQAAYSGNTDALHMFDVAGILDENMMNLAKYNGTLARRAGQPLSSIASSVYGGGALISPTEQRQLAENQYLYMQSELGSQGVNAHGEVAKETFRAKIAKLGKEYIADPVGNLYTNIYNALDSSARNVAGTAIIGSGYGKSSETMLLDYEYQGALLKNQGIMRQNGTYDSAKKNMLLGDDNIRTRAAVQYANTHTNDTLAQINAVIEAAESMLDGELNGLVKDSAVQAIAYAGAGGNKDLYDTILKDLSSKDNEKDDVYANLKDPMLIYKLPAMLQKSYDVDSRAMYQTMAVLANDILKTGGLQEKGLYTPGDGTVKLGTNAHYEYDEAKQTITIHLSTSPYHTDKYEANSALYAK